MLPIKKIIAPIDFSEPSLAALDAACELAIHFRAQLTLVHIVTLLPSYATDAAAISGMVPIYDDDRLGEATRLLRDIAASHIPAGIESSLVVRMGLVTEELLATAGDVGGDLLVIATHGCTGWRHLVFGSIAEAIVRTATIPVLTIHAGQSPLPVTTGATRDVGSAPVEGELAGQSWSKSS